MSETKPDPSPSSGKAPKRSFQAPKGTRDLYPADLLKKRYIEHCWRAVSLRHGFEEIDGPTFETADLYRVKSGEGILGEMFGVYSGKDPTDIEAVQRGEPPFALRPEFTPTLARMYAARARQLPQPTKWFCVPNFFRAERPQRGRLREFQQWNVDVIGGDASAENDASVLSVACDALHAYGGQPSQTRIKCSNRQQIARWMTSKFEIIEQRLDEMFRLLDGKDRMSKEDFLLRAIGLGVPASKLEMFNLATSIPLSMDGGREGIPGDATEMLALFDAASRHGIEQWCDYRPSLARGLAYYTGTVFEVIAEGERAVAGGGRYDNLIELFGGPPTPACGFGMGDVVLANLLHDKGLMPEGRDLVEALSRPLPMRCDVFVIGASREDANEQKNIDNAVTRLVAQLRRGVESKAYLESRTSDDAAKQMKPWSAARYEAPPLHARRSYKSTRNVGKLLADASSCHARYAAIIERVDDASALAGLCTLKNLDTGEQWKDVPLTNIAARIQ